MYFKTGLLTLKSFNLWLGLSLFSIFSPAPVLMCLVQYRPEDEERDQWDTRKGETQGSVTSMETDSWK